MIELFFFFVSFLAFVWLLRRAKQQQQAKMVKDFEEFLRSHPEASAGLPIYKIEKVETSENAEMFLAYEDLSERFVGQGQTLEDLVATLQKKHPEQSIFARDGNEYYEIKPQ
jgi:hypothetical protein